MFCNAGDRTLTGAEVWSLLAEYQILPLLIKEMIIDQAIAQIQYWQIKQPDGVNILSQIC
jgi:hypothetical protein